MLMLQYAFLLGLALQCWAADFLDCPGNDKWYLMYRRCCKSDLLPNGCECFDVSKSDEHSNTLFHRPVCPEDLGLTFKLFTWLNQEKGAEIQATAASIRSTHFVGTKPTAIMVHGFIANRRDIWGQKIRKAFLELQDMNVILVDWAKGAQAPNYYQAAANTRMVGAMIAKLVYDLNLYTGAPFESFHLIGHSLGAHICGYAGSEIQRLTGQKVGRITGLDPAGPLFQEEPDNVHLDKTDADFVDVIHTDAETIMNGGFGNPNFLGHVDFFPNGGKNQPACPAKPMGIFTLLDVKSGIYNTVCSHDISIEYFIDSVLACPRPKQVGTKCLMGYHVDRSCAGVLYPDTTSEAPYCTL